MTKKAARKGTALSLKDFYETAPGKAPFEACLPSKPGTASWDAHSLGSTDYPNKFAPARRDNYKQPSSFDKGGDYSGAYGYGGYGQQGGGSLGAGYIKASYDRHPGSYHHRFGPADQDPEPYGHPRRPSQDAYREHPDQQQHAAPYHRPDSSHLLYQPPPPPPPPARRPAPVPEPVKEVSPAADARPPAAPVRVPPPRPKQEAAPVVADRSTVPPKPVPEPAKVPSTGASISKPASSELEQEATEQLAASAPKNDWAEKMARSALEKMANAKSSLLAGAPPAVPRMEFHEPEPLRVKAADVADAAAVDPALASDRPRLHLKPRSQLLVAHDAAAQQTGTEENAAAGVADAERKQLNVQPRGLPAQPATKEGERRPRLQLQARSKPLADTKANKDGGARKSIFGAARPREEVLKERGVAPSSFKSERTDRGIAAGHNGSRPSSRAASVASGMSEDDAWHTVSNKKAAAKQFSPHTGYQSPVGSYDMPDDVFFGNGRPAVGSYKAMPTRAFENDHSFSGGAYGSSYGFGGHDSLDANMAVEDDGPVFRRSLPVRSGQLF